MLKRYPQQSSTWGTMTVQLRQGTCRGAFTRTVSSISSLDFCARSQIWTSGLNRGAAANSAAAPTAAAATPLEPSASRTHLSLTTSDNEAVGVCHVHLLQLPELPRSRNL